MNRLITLGAMALAFAVASPDTFAQDRGWGWDRRDRRDDGWRRNDRRAENVHSRITRLDIVDASTNRSYAGDVITLQPGQTIELRVVGTADSRQRTASITVHPSWRLSDDSAAVITDHGDTASLTARGGDGRVVELTAVEANLSTVLRFRVDRPQGRDWNRPSWRDRGFDRDRSWFDRDRNWR